MKGSDCAGDDAAPDAGECRATSPNVTLGLYAVCSAAEEKVGSGSSADVGSFNSSSWLSKPSYLSSVVSVS